MGELAKLAKASKLRGAVCVTDVAGTTYQYDDEAAAEEAWGSKVGQLTHNRGAFFEKPIVISTEDTPGFGKPRKATKKTSRRSRSIDEEM